MERNKKLLTSVNVDRKNHKQFKVLCIENGITFQQLVNVSVELYLKDKKFRELIKNSK